MSSPSGVSFEQCVSSLAREPCQKKSARELRQGGSNYRCCIPALAGFVSPQSIAPDGAETSAQDRHRANRVRKLVHEAREQITEQTGGGKRKHPGPDDAFDHGPFDAAETFHGADTHDGSGDDVGGGKRNAVNAGALNDERGS